MNAKRFLNEMFLDISFQIAMILGDLFKIRFLCLESFCDTNIFRNAVWKLHLIMNFNHDCAEYVIRNSDFFQFISIWVLEVFIT